MKQNILVIFFIILAPIPCIAQADSLSTKSFEELAFLIEKHGQTESDLAIPYCHAYLEKAKEVNDIEKQWKGYVSFTNLYRNSKLYNISSKYADSTIHIFEKFNLTKYGYNTFMAAGRSYMGNDVLLKSLEYFNKALKFAQKDKNIEQIQGASYLITLMKSTGGDYQGAVETQKELINSIELSNTSELSSKRKEVLIFVSEVSIADTYVKAKKSDSAYHYSKIALEKGLKLKDSCIIKELYWLLGNSELLQKKYDKAKVSFEKSKKYCLPFSKLDSLAVGSFIGKVYAAKKNYKLAIKEFENAFESANISEMEEGFMDDFYKILALCYKEEGELEKANVYFEKYINTLQTRKKINDTINRSFRNQEIDEFKFDLSKLNFEKNRKQTYLNYAFLVSAIIILILLLLLLKFYTVKKENEKKLNLLIENIETTKIHDRNIEIKNKIIREENISEVPKEVKLQIIDGLKKLEIKEYFLNQDCNLYNVSKKIGTNTSYLSKVINSYYGKNFNTYINDLRINYVIIRIKDDVLFRAYSIQSIAKEIGYKSANSFTKYFKNHTGLNPSFYIKNIKNFE